MRLFSRFRRAARPEPEPRVVESDAEETYRCGEISAFPVGDGTDVVYTHGSREARLLSSDVVALLVRCQAFATVTDHARALGQELGLDAPEIRALGHQLAELVGSDLLISRQEFLDRCRDADGALAAPPAIASIGLLTHDRVEGLAHAASSYAGNASRHGRACDLVVIDQSENAEHARANRAGLRALADRSGVSIAYAGREDTARFAEALARRAGVPREVVDFALFDVEGCGGTYGAGRNALLLHTAGDMFFSADDDTLCQIAGAPEAMGGDGLACLSLADPTEVRFFADREEILRSTATVEADLLGLHETLLGQSLAHCVAATPEDGELTLGPMGSRWLRGAYTGTGRVLATFSGLRGDSGIGSSRYCLTLTGPSRERLVDSESTYRAAVESREIVRAVDRPTISEGGFFMTTFLGLDNRETLPPFFPVRRNEDAVFGFALRLCAPNGFVGFLPWTLLHAPPPRPASPEAMWPRSIALSHLVMACMASFTPPPGASSTAAILPALGRHLIETASLNLRDFEDVVRLARWAQDSAYIGSLESLLDLHAESPDYWAADVRRAIATLRDTVGHEQYVRPRDLLDGRGDPAVGELARRLVLGYGRVLEAWPALVRAARDLRADGQRLAAPA